MTVDVFAASNMPTAYPWKLQKPSTVNDRVRDTADTFIMDSGIGDDVSNAEVLDLAHEYAADYVIAKDYLHDHEATTESVRAFMDAYETHPCTATPMVPLQPPHAEHYADLSGFDTYVLGGMAVDEVDTEAAVEYLRAFDDAVHDGAYIHALGVGGGIEFVRAVAGTGWVDSIDCSTPEMAAMFGCVLDAQLRQSEVREHSGDGAAKRNIPLAAFNSWQIRDVWTREAREGDTAQTRLGEVDT